MVAGEPVNVSGRSYGLCVTGELDSGPGRMSSGRSHGLYVIEELGRCVTGEIVKFSPTSEIDVRGAQHIRQGSPHLSG